MFRTQRGLGHRLVVAGRRDPAQIGVCESESIRAPQDRTHVPCRANVIQQDGKLLCAFLFFALPGFGPQFSLKHDLSLSPANRAADTERMSLHQGVTQSTRVTCPDLVRAYWHAIIIHATI